jgi:hypothetical protein
MYQRIIDLARKRFIAICAAFVLPATGVWFTYWERDQSHRESIRAFLDSVSKSHKSFIDELSDHLIKGDFRYLQSYMEHERIAFMAFIKAESQRLMQPLR